VRTLEQRVGLVVSTGGVLLMALCGSAVERSGSFERALELLDKGVVLEAINELELFVAVHPDHEQARMELARTLNRVKRDRRTAEEAANVLRINPDNAEARRLLTRIRIKLGRDLDRRDPVAVLDYARLCARPETYDRAADFYRLYLELDDDPLIHMEFAKVLYWAERYDEAKRHLEIYLASKPEDPQMRALLGQIDVAMGSFGEAVEQYRLSLLIRPGDIDLQLKLARALMWDGQDAEAEVLLNTIHKRSADYDEPLMLLASIARVQGRVQEEYALCQEVLKATPDHGEALARVAELRRGNRLEIAICQDRLLIDPSDTETRRRLIDYYLVDERFGEAIPHLEVLNSQDPHDLEALAELRFSREEEGRRSLAAVAAFHEHDAKALADEITRVGLWVRDNPNDYRSRGKLADLLLRSKAYAAAVEHLEILESMMPTDRRAAEKLLRARVLMQGGGGPGVPEA